MFKITPLKIQLNYLDMRFLFSWPDTTPVNMNFIRDGATIGAVVDAAAVVVENDMDAQAIKAEMQSKGGMIKVTVEGFPEEESIFVGQIREYTDGHIFMCLGPSDKLVPDNFDLFSEEIWSAKDST